MSIIGIAIAKGCHGKKRRGICEPVLVADVTSTGNRYQPVLLRAATSTGQPSDQYWLLSPPCADVRYGVVVQCIVVCSLVVPFPSGEKEISSRWDCRLGVRWRLLQLDGIEGDRPRECFGFRQEFPLRIPWRYPLAIGLKGLNRMLV